MSRVDRLLLVLLILGVLAYAASIGAQMRANHLCMSAGFAEGRVVGTDVYCLTTIEGTVHVAKIVDGKIYIVIEGDAIPLRQKRI